ncbi:PREDICTED: vegetative cell wall protein gp1-like, partial [Priapulus caudatus]|uniref:Vegetative cell wall protein gp1-like n=1 Tax=Priapulus caudatus TaxID=37621 RepID=A0ABM1EQV8_PRICU
MSCGQHRATCDRIMRDANLASEPSPPPTRPPTMFPHEPPSTEPSSAPTEAPPSTEAPAPTDSPTPNECPAHTETLAPTEPHGLTEPPASTDPPPVKPPPSPAHEKVVFMLNDEVQQVVAEEPSSPTSDTSCETRPPRIEVPEVRRKVKEKVGSSSNGAGAPPPPPTFGSFTLYVDVKYFEGRRADVGASAMAALGGAADLRKAFDTHSYDNLKSFVRGNNWPAEHGVRAELWSRLVAHMNRDTAQDMGEAVDLYKDTVQTIFRGR